jgi:hypothetical protein
VSALNRSQWVIEACLDKLQEAIDRLEGFAQRVPGDSPPTRSEVLHTIVAVALDDEHLMSRVVSRMIQVRQA